MRNFGIVQGSICRWNVVWSLVYKVGEWWRFTSFCILIVQGIMTVMVSVSVHGLYILKAKLLFGVKIRYI